LHGRKLRGAVHLAGGVGAPFQGVALQLVNAQGGFAHELVRFFDGKVDVLGFAGRVDLDCALENLFLVAVGEGDGEFVLGEFQLDLFAIQLGKPFALQLVVP
jgi:hypothetical protein